MLWWGVIWNASLRCWGMSARSEVGTSDVQMSALGLDFPSYAPVLFSSTQQYDFFSPLTAIKRTPARRLLVGEQMEIICWLEVLGLWGMGVPVSRIITLRQECAGFDQALPRRRPSRARGDTQMQDVAQGWLTGQVVDPLLWVVEVQGNSLIHPDQTRS